MPSKKQGLPHRTSASPHIRDKTSVPGIMWTVVLALLPLIISSLFFFGLPFFRTVTVALASALLSEMALRKIFQRRVSLYDGSAVITALLYALLLPPGVPSWMVALGAVFAVVVGKEIFGGLGQNPFNPALLGVAFLSASFPFIHDLFLLPLGEGMVRTNALLIFLGGLLLLIARVIHWETPLFYLGALCLTALVKGGGVGPYLFSGPILLGAFFLLTDPVTGPWMRPAERWYAMAAGFLTLLMARSLSAAEAVTWSILLMNALNPWLDRRFLPALKRA